MRRALCSKFIIEGVRVYLHVMYNGNVQQNSLYAQHPVSLRIFPCLPGSRLRFFIAMKIQPSTAAVHTVFDAPDPKLITLQIRSSLRSQYKILKCFATQQHYLLQSMNNMFLHVLRECTVVCSMRRTLRSKLVFGRA